MASRAADHFGSTVAELGAGQHVVSALGLANGFFVGSVLTVESIVDVAVDRAACFITIIAFFAGHPFVVSTNGLTSGNAADRPAAKVANVSGLACRAAEVHPTVAHLVSYSDSVPADWGTNRNSAVSARTRIAFVNETVD